MPLSLTKQAVGGNRGSQPQRVLQDRSRSVRRSRLLMPINRAPSVQHARQIRRLVQFHQRRHAASATIALCSRRSRRSSRHSAISSTASAPAARASMHLIRVDDEILPQQGRSTAAPDSPEIVEAALEIGPIGQHADAGRTVLLVDSGDLDRMEIGANHALATGWPFSPRRSGGSGRGRPGRRKNRGPAEPRPTLARNCSSGMRALAAAISRTLVGDDFVEDGGHSSMLEMPPAGEDHRQAVLVAGGDHCRRSASRPAE